MTQPISPLTDNGKQLVFAAANIVYDPQGVKMIQQALQNTKSEKAIAPAVALAATTLLHQMGPKLNDVSEDEMWGKHGVVHSTLDAIFEVAKHLGYKAPRSDLKKAYEIVEEQMESTQSPGNQQQDAQSDPQMAQPAMPMNPMQGAMPQPQQQTSPMQGAMPS